MASDAPSTDGQLLHERIEADLRAAEEAGDRTRAAALQSVVLAMQHAAAKADPAFPEVNVAAILSGAEMPRVVDVAAIDEEQLRAVIVNEIVTRRRSAAAHRRLGNAEHADQVDDEIAVLTPYVED